MGFSVVFLIWFTGAALTVWWLSRTVNYKGLSPQAQFILSLLVWAASALFPLTLAWAAAARLRGMRYVRKH